MCVCLFVLEANANGYGYSGYGDDCKKNDACDVLSHDMVFGWGKVLTKHLYTL